jgi:succinate dehydrogenase / fumarate reductase cytochrome b subunit
MSEMTRARPGASRAARPGAMRLIDATKYRLPLAAYVSILHRLSGAMMFVLLPLLIWLFDKSVTSEVSFEVFRSAFAAGIGFVPAWLLKLVLLGLIWAFLHHFVSGLRHLWMDATHSVSKAQGRQSAVVTLVVSLPLTAVLGAKLFGLF